jgi:hypothetical protein
MKKDCGYCGSQKCWHTNRLLLPVKLVLRFFTGEPLLGYTHRKTNATFTEAGTTVIEPELRYARHWWS